MYAFRDAKFKTSEMLIKRGADYNLTNSEGKSARDIAYKVENGAGITALIEAIELNKLCDQEETPVLSLGNGAAQIVIKRVKSQAENELLMDVIEL